MKSGAASLLPSSTTMASKLGPPVCCASDRKHRSSGAQSLQTAITMLNRGCEVGVRSLAAMELGSGISWNFFQLLSRAASHVTRVGPGESTGLRPYLEHQFSILDIHSTMRTSFGPRSVRLVATVCRSSALLWLTEHARQNRSRSGWNARTNFSVLPATRKALRSHTCFRPTDAQATPKNEIHD